jgi:HK97 family phage major capsid protein
MNLKEQLKAKLARVKALADTATEEGREFTDAEAAEIERLVPEIEHLTQRVKRADEIAGKVKAIADQPLEDGSNYAPADGTPRRIDFNRLAKSLGAKIGREVAAKGLVSAGSVITDVPLVAGDPIETGHALPTLLDIIPVVQRSAPSYRYLRQITRTMNAAPVAPGATKPTSSLSIESVDGRLRVIAHLTEPLDKYDLMDAANLATWVEAELAAGLREALQDQVLNGDGTGENFTGLATTTGVQQVAYATGQLETLAAAKAALEAKGVAAAAFALSGSDWLAITSTRNAQGMFDMGGAVDAAQRRAWGVPVTVVESLTAGLGYAIGAGAVQISTDTQGVAAEWGTPADTFTKNQVVGRVEGRFNLDVLKPYGVASIDLSAA